MKRHPPDPAGESSRELTVSREMVEQFAELTGDHSALHVDPSFGRRSAYRANLVHGMLPVAYAALVAAREADRPLVFRGISGRFRSPVFVDERLSLTCLPSGDDEVGDSRDLQYVIRRARTGTILTTGNLSMGAPEEATGRPGAGVPSAPTRSCALLQPLPEQALRLPEISRGDEMRFEFALLRPHLEALVNIVNQGLPPSSPVDPAAAPVRAATPNILVACLFSTFVGMCIPGRYAMFSEFEAQFARAMEEKTTYALRGVVKFLTPSTATLLEDLSISEKDHAEQACATGKVHAQVTGEPKSMPTSRTLKQTEMDLQITNKVVLITGASRGIGETTAKLFALHGARVAVNYHRGEDDAKRVVAEIEEQGGAAIAVRADVADRTQVGQMIAAVRRTWDRIDVLVNNAVRDALSVPFLELAWEDLQRDIEVVVKGAFNCCQEVVPLMIEQGGGRIINISTVYTDKPPPGQTKYVVAKSGLIGLTRSLAVELAPHDILVNAVVPSVVETDLSAHIPRMFLEAMKNETPLGRSATAAEVAKTAVYLASSLASFTTGQRIMVTGGNPPLL